MPFDISGVFSRLYSWVNDRDTGVKINAPRMDAEFNGVKDAINAIVGQTQPFINPVKAPNGTAAAPSYTFDGDQDSGFYRIGPNQMGLAQGGVGLGQVFARGNILGTVSQSGGVPTGSVIERGSNANGEYVRFADGLQICTFRDSVTMSTTATGSIFNNTTSAGAWIFPSPFLTGFNPACHVHAQGSVAWATAGTVSVTSVTSRVVFSSIALTSTAVTLNNIAIGRWF